MLDMNQTNTQRFEPNTKKELKLKRIGNHVESYLLMSEEDEMGRIFLMNLNINIARYRSYVYVMLYLSVIHANFSLMKTAQCY